VVPCKSVDAAPQQQPLMAITRRFLFGFISGAIAVTVLIVVCSVLAGWTVFSKSSGEEAAVVHTPSKDTSAELLPTARPKSKSEAGIPFSSSTRSEQAAVDWLSRAHQLTKPNRREYALP